MDGTELSGLVDRKGSPPAVSFTALSGTGKTTLLVEVIAEFGRRGRRVGCLKHDAHDFEIDREGKDSWRLTAAGASPVVISSPEKIAVVRTGLRKEMTPQEIVARYMDGADLVLVEGYKREPLPKIEIHRAGQGADLLCVTREGRILDEGLIAVVSDEDLALPVPVLSLDDIGAICDFLERHFLGGA
jgi:molybdopterin-guanine dinucleotide biosynthesis protein MobB